ncbi:hypothetical protein ACFYNZ_24445 [Streptomyces kebangsaanensis]|uniref:M56 family peptidase n=1 Tax=Streptomyces kebangsaanensis TaxID=864058 RepID=A0ABW6L127_9ACTN
MCAAYIASGLASSLLFRYRTARRLDRTADPREQVDMMRARTRVSWWAPTLILSVLVALLMSAGTAQAATPHTVPPVSGRLTGYNVSGV